MDNRKERGSQENRHGPGERSDKDAENESAKKKFLDDWNHRARHQHGRHFRPKKMLPQGVDTSGDQHPAAAEQGNRGDEKTDGRVGKRIPVWFQPKIPGAPHID